MPQAMHATDHDVLDAGPRRTAAGAERYCVATGTVRPVEEMIRFVIDPHGRPVADLKRRLPGRGVWVTATRQALGTAVARKAFTRGFKRDVAPAADFVETTERLLEQSALAALGIAYKARRLVLGFSKVEAALAHDPVIALLRATDAGAESARKLDGMLHRRAPAGAPIAVVEAFTSAQLDLALGRSNVIHAALLGGRESGLFLARAEGLRRFRDVGPGTANASAPGKLEKDRNG